MANDWVERIGAAQFETTITIDGVGYAATSPTEPPENTASSAVIAGCLSDSFTSRPAVWRIVEAPRRPAAHCIPRTSKQHR
jgi:hypothetical protein